MELILRVFPIQNRKGLFLNNGDQLFLSLEGRPLALEISSLQIILNPSSHSLDTDIIVRAVASGRIRLGGLIDQGNNITIDLLSPGLRQIFCQLFLLSSGRKAVKNRNHGGIALIPCFAGDLLHNLISLFCCHIPVFHRNFCWRPVAKRAELHELGQTSLQIIPGIRSQILNLVIDQ